MLKVFLLAWCMFCVLGYTQGQCEFNCNGPSGGSCDPVTNTCVCNKGYAGKFCTCEPRCSDVYGYCKNDANGTCVCHPNWKGRNCLCPRTCPESDNWECGLDIKCGCRADTYDETKCCPNACETSRGLTCPTNDGVCKCTKDNKLIPWGSSPDAYTCCDEFCKAPSMVCTKQGCLCKIIGSIVSRKEDCRHPIPPGCSKVGDWRECGITPGQGVCDVDNTCKCWYGWAGGRGVYGYDGFVRADHCRVACHWTADYKPALCTNVQSAV